MNTGASNTGAFCFCFCRHCESEVQITIISVFLRHTVCFIFSFLNQNKKAVFISCCVFFRGLIARSMLRYTFKACSAVCAAAGVAHLNKHRLFHIIGAVNNPLSNRLFLLSSSNTSDELSFHIVLGKRGRNLNWARSGGRYYTKSRYCVTVPGDT